MTPGARENLRLLLADTIANVRNAGAALREPVVGPNEIATASTACARAETLLSGIRWALEALLRPEEPHDKPQDSRQA